MTIKIYIPNIGEDELEVTDIMVKNEDTVHVNQPLIILEGDKISMEVPSPNAGIVKSIIIQIGDKVKKGSLIMIFDHIKEIEKTTTKNKKNIAIPSNTPDIKKHTINHSHDDIHATPLIRHIARVFEINLRKIHGTGRKGRILREDIQTYIKNSIKTVETKYAVNQQSYISHLNDIPSWPQINFNQFGDIENIELKKIQRISGKNLQRNWIVLPHVTQFDEIDITELENFRKRKNKEFEKNKINLKITPIIFIMKAVANTLEKLPKFNSSLSENGNTLTLKKYINIGIAVNTNDGLIIPVIKNVNKKNITTLTEELAIILKKVFSSKNQLTISDTQGGCFTISSLGKLGGTAFTPIVNVPEVAILGISKSSIKPIWNGEKFIPKLVLPISLSYDHRVINGIDGAQFMKILNIMLSDIRNILM